MPSCSPKVVQKLLGRCNPAHGFLIGTSHRSPLRPTSLQTRCFQFDGAPAYTLAPECKLRVVLPSNFLARITNGTMLAATAVVGSCVALYFYQARQDISESKHPKFTLPQPVFLSDFRADNRARFLIILQLKSLVKKTVFHFRYLHVSTIA